MLNHKTSNKVFIILFFLFVNSTLASLCCYASESSLVDKENSALELTLSCPLGDFTNVSIYSFIVESLKKEKTTRKEALEMAIDDKEIIIEGGKPHSASVCESELSHIINRLCQSDENCIYAYIYDKSGLLHAAGFSNLEVFEKCNINFEVIIEDEIFEGYNNKKIKYPIVKHFSKYKIITYPIFFDMKNNYAELYYKQGCEELIGFVILAVKKIKSPSSLYSGVK